MISEKEDDLTEKKRREAERWLIEQNNNDKHGERPIPTDDEKKKNKEDKTKQKEKGENFL